MLCMNIKRPATRIVTFRRKSQSRGLGRTSNKVDWTNGVFGREDNNENLWSSYIDICGGDSGSPQMFYDYDKFNPREEPKFVLAAIATWQEGYFYNQDKQGYSKVPCGMRTINMEKYQGKPEEEAILQSISISQKITYPKIFTWIKNKIDWTR